jgi:thiamine-phosphate pyrophosphorylase
LPREPRQKGDPSLTPRLFLVAPEKPLGQLAACLEQACKVGDVASLLMPASVARELAPLAHKLGVAAIAADEARDAAHAGCDGLQVDADNVAEARKSLGKDSIIGAYAGHSRHAAMEAAEAGADYIAFSQNGPSIGGETVIHWWADMMEIPCVAFDPVDPQGLDTLLPQKPDFIRPSDAMWESPEAARTVIEALTARLMPR